jgi:rhomboid protease GluP
MIQPKVSRRDQESIVCARKQRWPTVTILATALTAAISLVGFAQPDVVDALRRSPLVWQESQWWRMLTPVLVNPEGWSQFASNMAGMLAIGITAERWFGARTWLISFLTGTVVGELAGLAWQPVGAGTSVAVCGLLGTLAVGLWQRVGTGPARFGAAVLLAMAVLLTCIHDIHGPPLLAGTIVALFATRCGPRRSDARSAASHSAPTAEAG